MLFGSLHWRWCCCVHAFQPGWWTRADDRVSISHIYVICSSLWASLSCSEPKKSIQKYNDRRNNQKVCLNLETMKFECTMNVNMIFILISEDVYFMWKSQRTLCLCVRDRANTCYKEAKIALNLWKEELVYYITHIHLQYCNACNKNIMIITCTTLKMCWMRIHLYAFRDRALFARCFLNIKQFDFMQGAIFYIYLPTKLMIFSSSHSRIL